MAVVSLPHERERLLEAQRGVKRGRDGHLLEEALSKQREHTGRAGHCRLGVAAPLQKAQHELAARAALL